MAELIREAIDDFLDQEDRLDSSFGAVPGIAERMPGREEWEGRG